MSRSFQLGLAVAVALAVAWWLDPRSAESRRVAEPAGRAPEESAPDRRISIARIEVEPPPSPPAPRPEPRAERAAPPSRPPAADAARPIEPSRPLAPSVRSRARGAALLRAGAFPRLRATYDRIGFAAYRDAMRALGARFFLYDRARRRPLAEVDPDTGAILEARVRRDLSPWPRDVTRHLPAALERGRGSLGSAVSGVILLPPQTFDAALLGALDQGLRDAGVEPREAVRFDVAYELRAGRLHCAVLAVGLRDGSERELPLVIDLSRRERAL